MPNPLIKTGVENATSHAESFEELLQQKPVDLLEALALKVDEAARNDASTASFDARFSLDNLHRSTLR